MPTPGFCAPCRLPARHLRAAAMASTADLSSPPADTSTINLADGRQLAFREYGDLHGLPVIFYQ